MNHCKSEKIYFTIETLGSGFTDQLMQFNAFYKLGTNMGYTYIHRPFHSPRSSNLYSYGSSTIHSLYNYFIKFIIKIRNKNRTFKKIMAESNSNIFKFLGFNDYLYLRNEVIDSPETINIALNDEVIQKQTISNLGELQKYIRDEISKTTSNKDTRLVKFQLTGKRRFFKIIHSEIQNINDVLNLRDVYFEKRRTWPWESIFPTGKVKTVVHMRQGDTAILKTPWDTFITLWPKEVAFNEYQYSDSIPSDSLIQLKTYLDVYNNLSSCLGTNNLSTLFFSDGFKHSFYTLFKHIDNLNFSKEQIKSIKRLSKTYEKNNFEGFKGIKNSRLLVGEEPEKLYHLVHSLLTADLVIVGDQQRMIPKFLASYCTNEHMPVVIVLKKTDDNNLDDSYKEMGLDDKMDKFIFLDISGIDYQQLSKKLRELLDIST